VLRTFSPKQIIYAKMVYSYNVFMSSNEKSTPTEAEPRELIREETSDLLELYKLENPSREDVKTLLEQHYARFGRVGFNSEVDNATIDNFYTYFTEKPHEYLAAELHFIQELLANDLNVVVEQGFTRSQALLPKQEYQAPQAVFLINGKRTDAKVLGNGQFGINLQNLFNKVYPGEGRTYDIKKAYDIVLNNCAHEGTHILEEQVEHTEKGKVNWAIRGAFSEGLATFSEKSFHFLWSDDYTKDSLTTLEIIKKLNPEITDAEKKEVITHICNMESLQKHRSHEIERTRLLLEKDNITLEDFERVMDDLLVHQNGPLYYAGYSVWRKIYETEGINKVREIVLKGPKAFSEYM